MAQVGIYEKALPQNISWKERFYLVKEMGFDFIEMSIDETDERLARLDWPEEKIAELRNDMFETGVRINSICLSGHRRFPFGSSDPNKQKIAKEIMSKAIQLAHNLSINVIQVAGYDVYYEKKSISSREDFIAGMKESVKEASNYGVILSVEIMDDPFMNSISKFLEIKKQIHSPYLQVYPDLGNLSAWPENDPARELEKRNRLYYVHSFEGYLSCNRRLQWTVSGCSIWGRLCRFSRVIKKFETTRIRWDVSNRDVE